MAVNQQAFSYIWKEALTVNPIIALAKSISNIIKKRKYVRSIATTSALGVGMIFGGIGVFTIDGYTNFILSLLPSFVLELPGNNWFAALMKAGGGMWFGSALGYVAAKEFFRSFHSQDGNPSNKAYHINDEDLESVLDNQSEEIFKFQRERPESKELVVSDFSSASIEPVTHDQIERSRGFAKQSVREVLVYLRDKLYLAKALGNEKKRLEFKNAFIELKEKYNVFPMIKTIRLEQRELEITQARMGDIEDVLNLRLNPRRDRAGDPEDLRRGVPINIEAEVQPEDLAPAKRQILNLFENDKGRAKLAKDLNASNVSFAQLKTNVAENLEANKRIAGILGI